MANIIIPTPLRKFTDGQATFNSEAATVKQVLVDLGNKHEGLKAHLLSEDGSIKPFIKVFVGENDINTLEQENTEVSANSEISIIPAIAGGSI